MESMAFLVDCFITRYWLYKRRRASFIFTFSFDEVKVVHRNCGYFVFTGILLHMLAGYAFSFDTVRAPRPVGYM